MMSKKTKDDAIRPQIVQSAVYLLKRDKKIVYIGESKNVYERIGQHIRKGNMEFDNIEIYPVPQDKREHIEYVLISTYLPEYNKQNSTDAPGWKKLEPYKRLCWALGIEPCYGFSLKNDIMIGFPKTVIRFIKGRIGA